MIERQCVLERPAESGIYRTVSWIPSDVAVMGRVVTLKEVRRDNQPARVNDWKVMAVHGERRDGRICR